jgi:hypothetical protein
MGILMLISPVLYLRKIPEKTPGKACKIFKPIQESKEFMRMTIKLKAKTVRTKHVTVQFRSIHKQFQKQGSA